MGARRPDRAVDLHMTDFSRLGEQLTTLLDTGARIFQFDAGDGHFIEPITIGPVVAKSISPIVHAAGGVLDCHLMVESPEKHFASSPRPAAAASPCTTKPAPICPA